MLAEFWSELRYRLRALVRRGDMERELDDELRFHIEHEAEKHIRQGVPRDEAMRRARLAFGGVSRIKDDTREARGVTFVEHVLQDIRYALRGLRARPLFTGAVVATLGLGVGVNTAMFGILDRTLFRPPRYLTDPASVHRLYVEWTPTDGPRRLESRLDLPRYRDFARWSQASSHFAAFAYRNMAVGDGDATSLRTIGIVTATYFDFFDMKPVVGRFFNASEDAAPAGEPVVVLAFGYWQSAYAGRTDVLGSTIRIGTGTYRVIGVAPPGFDGVSDQRVPIAFVPLTAFAHSINQDKDYGSRWIEILVRRKPGVTIESANADLTNAYERSWNAERALEPDLGPASVARPIAIAGPIQAARGPLAGPESKVLIWISGVAVVVLLIACANVANFLLARAVRRRREMSLRRAIGGSHARLLQQLLTETLVLATFGSLAGLLAAQFATGALRRLFNTTNDSWPVLTDARTLAFALTLTVVTAALAGILPALQSGRGDLAGSLKAGSREGAYRRSPMRTGLLLFQTALSVVLLVGAGLFLRSLREVRGVRLGYDVDRLAYVEASMRGVNLGLAEGGALADRLLAEARATPGVDNATQVVSVPFWFTEGRGLFVPGVDSVRKLGRFTLQAGTPEYFATLGTRIVRGRGILPEDRADAPRVVLVSETMARILWKGDDPIGKCIRISSDTMPCTTVVGVAEDMRGHSLTSDAEFTYYLPMAQYVAAFHQPQMLAMFVRVRGRPDDQAEALRARLQRLMPGASYVNVRAMHEIIDPLMQSWTSGAGMLLTFGALALTLAAVGLYAVIAFAVVQRTQELGVRIALGARVADVVRLVIGEGLRVTLAGLVIGAAIALIAGRGLTAMLYRVSPRDPAVFAIVALTLLVVGILASAIPALRAARVDPNVALRAD
jgi:predicted permease